MDFNRWSELRRGIGCPFDAPRPQSTEEWDLIAPLSVATLYLAKNQTYRGQCLLILDLRHASRPSELSAREWQQFCADLHRAEHAISSTLAPDHINLAALGNLIPHLHWHIIPRYRSDPRWGAPVYLTQSGDMPDTRLDPKEQLSLLHSLQQTLAADGAS